MLVFDKKLHTYTKNGRNLPSVTTIINDCDPNAFYRVPLEVMEKARQRGNAVHTLTEYYDKGILDESTIDPELQGYFDAYLKFLSDMNPEYDMIEKMVDSEMHGFAGTLDRTGEMQGYEFLLDIKSGCKSRWCGVQTSAYAKTIADNVFRKRFGLYLKSDGKYDLVEYSDPMDFNIFLSCLNVWNFKQK